MQIRREQGLCLVALGLAGLILWAGRGADMRMPVIKATPKAYDAPPGATLPLAAMEKKPPLAARERDFFVEPSESMPLPARELPFPKLDPAPVVGLPLPRGQHPAAWHQLRLPGRALSEPFAFPEAAGAGEGTATQPTESAPARAVPAGVPVAGPAAAGARPAQATREELIARHERRWDRVEVSTPPGQIWWGEIQDTDKWALDGKTTLQRPIRMRWVNPETGATTVHDHEVKPENVLRIVLSKHLRSQIEITRRKLPEDAAGLPQRAAFLEDLLRAARTETWVYAEARRQAETYARLAGSNEDGPRWRARVAREQGDLLGELAIYQGLPQDLAGSALQLGGLGYVHARLGLHAKAEDYLRQAVQKAPADPRLTAQLARFLTSRGRAAEAVPYAASAQRNKGAVVDATEAFEIGLALVECNLALGQLDAAREALSRVEAPPALAPVRDLWKGCVEYASGQREAAVAALQNASDGTQAATLALAAAKLAGPLETLPFVEVRTLLETVRDQDPMLRDRALCGLALLYERAGHGQQALVAAEAAVACNPSEPYALYLLGRERRLAGQFEAAIEALQRALRLSDASAEILVETALAELQIAQTSQAEDALTHLARGLRFVERAVALDESYGPTPFFLELQGRVAFETRDLRAARQAFERGAAKSQFCQLGIALVDYAQGRPEEAHNQLTQIREKHKRGDPVRVFAEDTIKLIEDWAGREQVRENFERADLAKTEKGELSKKWEEVRNGALRPLVQGGELVLDGEITVAGKPVAARKRLERAGDFLAVEARLTPRGDLPGRTYGLQLVDGGRAAGNLSVNDFRARFGVKDGQPYLQIQDGDPAQAQDPTRFDAVPLPPACKVEAGKPVRLGLEVVPRKEGDSYWTLRALWDGAVVHEREVTRLNKNLRQIALLTDLFAEAPLHQKVDAAFDEYRLVRRKDQGK